MLIHPLRFWRNFYAFNSKYNCKLQYFTFYCTLNCWYFETKNLHNHSHQRRSVKLKMYQNKSRLGLRPTPHWGSLQRSPRIPRAQLDYNLYWPLRASIIGDYAFWFSNVGLHANTAILSNKYKCTMDQELQNITLHALSCSVGEYLNTICI